MKQFIKNIKGRFTFLSFTFNFWSDMTPIVFFLRYSSMLSGLWQWIKRHRRKLALTALLAGGLWYASRWLSSSISVLLARQQALEQLSEARRSQHLTVTLRNADLTTLNLLPRLFERLDVALNVEQLTEEIKSNKSATETAALLNELKRRSVARAVAAVLCAAFMGTLVRLQLAVLAGYVFRGCVECPQQDQKRNHTEQRPLSEVHILFD